MMHHNVLDNLPTWLIRNSSMLWQNKVTLFLNKVMLKHIKIYNATISVVTNITVSSGNLGIVGGTSTDISLHPYQVSLQYLFQHFCGAFLISSTWVVTAAHCITQGYSRNLNIRAGSSTTTSGGQTAAVSGYALHPSYSDSTMDNDVALLLLSSAITLNANARAASLPTAGAAIPDNALVMITGWGATRENGAGSATLQQVQVPTVNRQTCQRAYLFLSSITNNMFCAGVLGTGGRDACQGDSGGPVAYNGQVVGVVSFGYGCARANFPGVYAQVSSFRTWIRQVSGI